MLGGTLGGGGGGEMLLATLKDLDLSLGVDDWKLHGWSCGRLLYPGTTRVISFSHIHQAQWKEEQERVTRITLPFKNK